MQTERLTLRPFERSDLDALVELHAIPEFWWFPLQRGQTREEAAAFLERRLEAWTTRGFDLWVVERRAAPGIIGWAGLSEPAFLPEILPAIEVGWRFDPAVWHQGFATEAGEAALRFGFEEIGLERIVSVYEPENVASGRVMERLGLTFERDTVHPERHIPLRVTAITREQWRERVASARVR